MIHESEIREQLAHLLAERVSLASFERWLNASRLPLSVDVDDDAFRLAAKVALLISERHDHVIEDHELNESLIALLNNIVVSQPLEIGAEQQRRFDCFKAEGLLRPRLVAA